MSAVTVIISLLIIVVAIVVIVSVLMQEGSKQGLGAIGGGAETFFGKNKAKSYEGKLAMITKVSVVVFIVLAIAMTMVISRTGSDETATDGLDTTVIEEHDHDHEGEEAVEGETTETETDGETVTEPTAEPEATVEATEEPAAEATEASDAE